MFSPTPRRLAPLLVSCVLVACNNGAGYSNTVPTPAPIVTATATATPNTGQSASAQFTTAGGTLTFGPWANAAGTKVSLTSTWGANNQTSATVAGSLSAGSGDLVPPNSKWTAYNLAGTVVIYLEFTALPATAFMQSPALTFTTSAGVTGSSCTIASFSNGAWQTVLSGGVLSTGNTTITFAAQTPAGGVSVGNAGSASGPSYLALVCS